MPELLVYAAGPDDRDPTLLRRGSILRAEPTGFQWGRRESFAAWRAGGGRPGDWHGKTVIVIVPDIDLSLEDARSLAEPAYVVVRNGREIPNVEPGPGDELKTHSRRKARLDLARTEDAGDGVRLMTGAVLDRAVTVSDGLDRQGRRMETGRALRQR
ncbi:hypothetical protein [Oceanibacterium hippocampi]|uniref:Uncharacterized protein n=1 Tax=Oceanibacterium hippocampi TaxID=745714 RepID=A0A1Y5S7C8_9PROT|nr:hypothetical protein [Oceanibacterium hippocampi]SLN31816.1 hypothetical protein OCH7691_01157 [Oceanibacterium hippocampi]